MRHCNSCTSTEQGHECLILPLIYSVVSNSVAFPATVGFRYLDVLPGWRLIDVAPNPHPSIPPRFCPAVSSNSLLWFPAQLHWHCTNVWICCMSYSAFPLVLSFPCRQSATNDTLRWTIQKAKLNNIKSVRLCPAIHLLGSVLIWVLALICVIAPRNVIAENVTVGEPR